MNECNLQVHSFYWQLGQIIVCFPMGILLQSQFKSLFKSELRLQSEHVFILWEDGPEMVQLLLEHVWTPRQSKAKPYHLFVLKRGRKSSTRIATGMEKVTTQSGKTKSCFSHTWAPTSWRSAKFTGSTSMSVLMAVWSNGHALRWSLFRQVLHTVWEQPKLMGLCTFSSNSL